MGYTTHFIIDEIIICTEKTEKIDEKRHSKWIYMMKETDNETMLMPNNSESLCPRVGGKENQESTS